MPEDLFAAVYDGADDTLVRLLRAGVPADATDEDGQTALYLAAVSDRPTAVRLLLAAGADPQRASGEDGGDLPLCGAASGGHTVVVRALLAAGADPDRQEAFGFTAVAWAAVQGFADTLGVLLDGGADPDLPGPGGERPLVLAARRGSPSAVRALLRHGAGAGDPGVREAALAEARRWAGLDVERELREALLRAYGSGYETAARRTVVGGSETVTVELLVDGVPVAGRAQETGHAAVVTVLERALGVPVSYKELAGRALRCGDPVRDDWRESVRALAGWHDEETFQVAAVWLAGDDELRRTFAVDVLAGVGDASVAARAVPLLRRVAERAGSARLASAVVRALGRLGGAGAVPGIVRHAAHRDAGVRRRVAEALAGAEGAAAMAALTGLSGDPEVSVRRLAVAVIAGSYAREPAAREALVARLDDPDDLAAARAAAGLAAAGEARVVAVLERLLARADPDGPARETAAAAVESLEPGPVRARLERIPPRRREDG